MIDGISLLSEDGRSFDPTTRWQNGPEFLLICKTFQIDFFFLFSAAFIDGVCFHFRVDSSPCLYCLHRSNVEEEGAWEPSNHWRNNRLCNEWRSGQIFNLKKYKTAPKLFGFTRINLLCFVQSFVRILQKGSEPPRWIGRGAIGKRPSLVLIAVLTKEASFTCTFRFLTATQSGRHLFALPPRFSIRTSRVTVISGWIVSNTTGVSL